jgi:hypothetical protein
MLPQLLTALLLSAAPACAAPARAVWTWEPESYAILQDTAAASAAEAFLFEKGIRTVYLYADAYGGRNLIKEDPRLYCRTIRAMHARGLRVYALLGSWFLHTERYVLPEHRAEARAMFKRVLDYNAASAPAERFDGVNLDIEPHMLGAWQTDSSGLLLNFLDLGRELMAMKRRAGARLQVGPAVPFWLDGVTLEWRGARKPASQHVQDVYDYVALMDYRDRAEGRDGMIEHAAAELAYAAKTGKKVAVGVEVTPNEIEKVSFDHLAEADLERELALAGKAFSAGKGFAGFVIHHYGSYRSWLERRRAAEGK